jgi:hypothetical protein
MSEHWPTFGSNRPKAQFEADGSSSPNGARPEDAIAEPDGSAEEPVATFGDAEGESPTATEVTGEAVVSDPDETDAAEATPTADTDGGATAAAVDAVAETTDEPSVFVADLLRAMQTTAGLERVKIAEDTERRRQAHIDVVRAREASEADRMRELAAEDMKTIEAWADDETKRIQVERERRATELQSDLEGSLALHRSKIDKEIEGVETAIATYRAEVGAFFDGLEHESDLVMIARQAARRPVFPTLDLVAATTDSFDADSAVAGPSSGEAGSVAADDDSTGAAAAEATGSAAVGVMDSEVAPEPVDAWATSTEPSAEPDATGTSDEVGEVSVAGEPAETVAAVGGPNETGSGSLLESVPISRPMSWFRRDTNGGDR